jgi:ferric-dicitrate binding protein FerR (iron transport regulator)
MSSNKSEQIIAAIAARLAGVATEEDDRLVDAWRATSGRNEAFYQRVTRENLMEKSLAAFRQEDIQAAWERVERAMDASRSRGRLPWRRYAAAAAAILVALPLAYRLLSPAARPAGDQEDPVSPRAQLILSDGTKVSIHENNEAIIRDSAGVVIHREGGRLDYSKNKTASDTTLMFHELIMANGMEYTTTLSDGTIVSLNAESRLRYPVNFAGKQRVVEFEGEAYFEVARDTEHPFVVRTGGMEITVLGTEFNLRAYRDEPLIATTLVEGSVQVSNGNENYRIVPGEQGLYERATRTITTREVDVTLYTAWYRHEIKFKDMPLEDIMRNLARWYGITYTFLDSSVKKIEFGGCFDRYDKIDPILDMLRRTELVEVVVKDEQIYISKKR